MRLEHLHIVVHYECGCLKLRPVRTTDYETLDGLDRHGELWVPLRCKVCDETHQSRLAARYGKGL